MECFESNLILDNFIHLPGKIFPCYTHIGDNVQFKFGGMETHLHIFCPIFEKKIKMHVRVCLEIFGLSKNCDLIFIG